MTPAAREDRATVHGTCSPAFEPLRDVLAANLADGSELGASLAVIQDGEMVADLWGGEARPGEPWGEDTIVQVWSVTKTMAALTVLVLADRGVLDLDAPVATYWDGFRDERVLVRHVLAHTSGLAGWTERLDVATMLDLERSEEMLARQEPWWEPGTTSGYHMMTYGHLVDGIVRGATGASLADQFRVLVAEPLGADFHLGVPTAEHHRIADLVAPTAVSAAGQLPPDSLYLRTVTNPLLDVPAVCHTPTWRSTSVAAFNGHGNARSMARAQAIVSHGGELDGRRLLGPDTLDRIFEVQADGTDRVLPASLRWGIGYALPTAVAPEVPSGRVCWWTGWGGSIVVNDLDRRLTIAYAMNRMKDHYWASPRTDRYLRTALGCVEATA